jgi:hypothetical protein
MNLKYILLFEWPWLSYKLNNKHDKQDTQVLHVSEV